MKKAWVYILRCSDNSYYTGSTTDLPKRVAEHQAGAFSGYTAARLPAHLVYSQEFPDIGYAIQAERQIKGWSRQKKEALINSDFRLLHELSRCRNKSHHSCVGYADRDQTRKFRGKCHGSTPLTMTER